MADKQENVKEKDESQQKNSASIGIVTWLILAVMIAVFTGSGLLLGRIFAKPAAPLPAPAAPNTAEQDIFAPAAGTPDGLQSSWFYDIEPVVANLNEPGATRYIRVSLTMELNGTLDQKAVTEMLEGKKPLITNSLTIYLAGLRLADIQGDKNLMKIQSQILELMNEKLFGESQPMIKSVLFKEFAVQ